MTKGKGPGEHKALMQRIVALFATGDLSSVDVVIAAGYTDHQGLERIEIRGPEGFSRVVRAARCAFPALQVDIEELIAEGDRVVARLRWRGTQSTGERVERETIDVVRVANGQAVEHWGTQMGLLKG
jgi:predicted SnoaL-like aldol condensation-catalyzing enzyme